MPADQPTHGEPPALAGDLIGPRVERLSEIRQARSPIEERQQQTELNGGKLALLHELQDAIKRCPRGEHRSIARSADVLSNHAPIVPANRGRGNGYQPAFSPAVAIRAFFASMQWSSWW